MNSQSHRPLEPISSQVALDSIVQADQDQIVILDFDETLWLRNSTAEYINSLRPRWLGFMAIALLKILQPWKWLPRPFRGDKVKDWFLVAIATILLPWNLLLWRKQARELARQGNPELMAAVNCNSGSRIIVASLGFKFIIEPILRELPISYESLVCCKFWQGAKDRGKGKLLMMQEILSASELRSAILITDSEDDLPLLEIVGQPCLVIWSLAEYRHPFRDFWVSSTIQKLLQQIKIYL